MRVFIYNRKSSEDKSRQVLSLESQLRETKRSLERATGVEVIEIFQESLSAHEPGRPVFNEMLARIEKGEADAIAAWKPNRLARNPVDGGQIMHLLDRGVLKHLYFATYTFENSPQGKFFLQIMFGESKYYSDNLSQAVKTGNRTKVERGWMPRRAPLGYLNAEQADGEKIIIADPERFELIREMWRMLLSGAYSAPQIGEIARNDWGLTTPKRRKIGGKLLSVATTYRIFHNPFYAGVIRNEGRLYPGKHPAMVTLDEYERVQQLITGTPRLRKQHTFAYTGLIRCGECGYAVTAEDKTNRYGTHYTYYHCTKRNPSYRCSQGYVQEVVLEDDIRGFLGEVVVPERIQGWAEVELGRLLHDRKHGQQAVIKSVDRRREALLKERDNLIKMCRRELLTEEEYLAERKEIDQELLRLDQRESRPKAEKPFEPHELLISFSSRAVSWFDEGDPAERRLIFEIAGSNPTLKDRRLSIEATPPLLRVPRRPNLHSLCGFIEAIETDLASDDQPLIALVDKLRELKRLREGRLDADSSLHDLGAVP